MPICRAHMISGVPLRGPGLDQVQMAAVEAMDPGRTSRRRCLKEARRLAERSGPVISRGPPRLSRNDGAPRGMYTWDGEGDCRPLSCGLLILFTGLEERGATTSRATYKALLIPPLFYLVLLAIK